MIAKLSFGFNAVDVGSKTTDDAVLSLNAIVVVVPIDILGVAPVIPVAPLVNPKFMILLVDVPVNVTVGAVPLAKYVTVPTVNVGVIPLVPFAPFSNPKFNTGLALLPVNVTVSVVPLDKPVTVPTEKTGITAVELMLFSCV